MEILKSVNNLLRKKYSYIYIIFFINYNIYDIYNIILKIYNVHYAHCITRNVICRYNSSTIIWTCHNSQQDRTLNWTYPMSE